MGPVVGDDGVARCPWAGSLPSVMRDYHDAEWGHRVHGEAAYLERLTLEAFQSGLSWSTILNKREAFREVFHGFDADAVAAFGPDDEARLMADARIVRNRAKISAAIVNARATVALRDAEGLEALVLSFAPDQPPAPTTPAITSRPTWEPVPRSRKTAAITSPAAKCPMVVTASADITQRCTEDMLIDWRVAAGRGLAGSIRCLRRGGTGGMLTPVLSPHPCGGSRPGAGRRPRSPPSARTSWSAPRTRTRAS